MADKRDKKLGSALEEDPYAQAQQGPPSDFGGPVFPNTDNVESKLDTDNPTPEPMSGGGKMDISNAPADGSPKMDTSNPHAAQVVKGQPQDIDPSMLEAMSAKKALGSAMGGKKPMGSAMEGGGQEPIQVPAEPPKEAPVAPPDVHQAIADQHALITKDKLDAAKRGDMVGMGMATLQGNVLNSTEPMKSANQAAQQPAQQPLAADAPGDQQPPSTAGLGSAMPTYTGKDRIGGGTPGEAEAKQQYKDKLADFDHRMAAAAAEHTPEGLKELGYLEKEKALFEKQNPLGSATNHPGVLGKVEHVLGGIGNALGNAFVPEITQNIPGSSASLAQRRQQGESDINAGQDLALKDAQADQATAKANGSAIPKLLPGEENVRTLPNGVRERAYQMPDKTIAWAPEGTLPGQVSAQPTAGAAPAAQGTPNGASAVQPGAPKGQPTYGKQTPENTPADASHFADDAKTNFVATDGTPLLSDGQIKSAVNALGLNPTQKMVADQQARMERMAKAKQDQLNHDAELKDKGVDADNRAEAKEDRAQDRKDKQTRGYAEDENGKVQYMSEYDAKHRGLTFEPMSNGDVNKDRAAHRQLNDVQMNTSQYTKAAQEYKKANISDSEKASDNSNIDNILNKAGLADFKLKIGEGGEVSVPFLNSFTEALSRESKSQSYNNLSPQGKALLDGYIKTMSAVPAYQKALTGIGRSNKEMLDLELANIPLPTMRPDDILSKQQQFQHNLDRAYEGFPENLPGISSQQKVRGQQEGTTDIGGIKSNGVIPNGQKGIFGPDGQEYETRDGKLYNLKTGLEYQPPKKK